MFGHFQEESSHIIRCSIGKASPLDCLIDSGADANIVGESDWLIMEKEYNDGTAALYDVCHEPQVTLSGYAARTELTISHSFKAWVTICDAVKPKSFAEFFVVKGGKRSLLGRATAKSTKVLNVGLEVNAIRVEVEPFPSIPGVIIDFDVDESVAPVRHAYVSIPAHFQEPATAQIKEMEATQIIERVTTSPRWLSGLSAVRKGKGGFRLVVNMQGPNKAIRRQYHRMPRVEEMRTKLNGSKWFTKLDLSSAFYHLRLSERSKEMTTFMAPDGMYRFTRLVFGVNCAPEIFQRQMESILEGIENVIVYIDDILSFAASKEELETTTDKVTQRLKEHNLTINAGKCEYNKESLTFLGHQLSAKGLNIEEQKVKDIEQFRRPRNGSELKSFLGLVNYVRDFIPGFADLTRPLRKIDGLGKFRWEEEQETAFTALKKAIIDCTVTQGYFSLEDKTEIYTDASPYAVGAVLTQTDSANNKRIISFASKSLTETEQRYAQTQREALAVVWGVEHFHYYLLGSHFTIKTDAQGMKFIFEKTPKGPKRLLRRAEGWAMRLDPFDYDIEFVRGLDNIADPSSRLFQSNDKPVAFEDEQSPGEVAVIQINNVDDVQFDEDHLPILQVKMATERSVEINRVIAAIESGVWDQDLAIYKSVEDQLEVVNGLLMKTGLVVLPPELRDKAMRIAHSGHLGITKTKSILKERVWWPRINKTVEDWIMACRTCILNGRRHAPVPMMRTRLPETPWEYVAIDYCGPFALLGDIHVIGIVDYHSRYILTAIVKSTGWKHLEPVLDEIFYRFGYARLMKSDNGPPFSGKQYKEYCAARGVETVFSWPLNPQQNGAAESTMKHINRAIQNATAENSDIAKALRDRVQAHNSARHRETNEIPSEVMFGRRLRTGLPLAQTAKTPLNPEEMKQHDWEAKMKKKASEDKRRRAASPNISVGSTVVLERAAKRKGETPYDPTELVVTGMDGGSLVMQDPNGSVIRRDITKVRELPQNNQAGQDTSTTPQETAGTSDNEQSERPKRSRQRTDRLVFSTIKE